MDSGPGSIVLISCYELGHQPLSLASPLAALRQAGFQPLAVDTSLQDLPDDVIREAQLVALAVPMHTALRLAEPIARRVRATNSGAHLSFYGLYAWLNAASLFEAGLADSVIGGEYEAPLVDLARSLTSSSGWARGVRYPDHFAAPNLDRPEFNVPERQALPALTHYAGLQTGDAVVPAGYVEATHGCKHTCAHCPITPVYAGRFFAVPRDIVLADIRNQVHSGARHITFGDPDFLNGPTHALRLARALHAEFPTLTFDATIKVEHILRHAQVFPELKELGCVFVVSAIESLSDEVLRRLRKGHTAADVSRALDIMAEACIPLRPTFVSFTPWTSLADYLELLRFVERRGLMGEVDPVQYAIRLLLPPGSALLAEPDASGWLRELDAGAFSYRWSHPDSRMDQLYATVSGIVGTAEHAGQPVQKTFGVVRAAAYTAAGLEPPAVAEPEPAGSLHPRLTESWFC